MDIIVTARKSPTRALIENCLEFYKRELKLTNSSYSLVVMTDRGMGTKEGSIPHVDPGKQLRL